MVNLADGGELAPGSTKSWNANTPEGERLQAKSRTATDPGNAGERPKGRTEVGASGWPRGALSRTR